MPFPIPGSQPRCQSAGRRGLCTLAFHTRESVFTAAHKFAVVSGRPGEHQDTDEERSGAEPGKITEWGCQDHARTTRSPPVPPVPLDTRRSSLGSRCPQLHPCHGTGSAHPSWAGGAVADGSVPQTRATEEVFVSSGVMKGCCCPNSAWIRARRSSQTRSQGSSCGAAACCLDPNAARNEGLCAQPAFSPPLPPAAVPGAAPMPPAPGSSWAAPVPSTPSPKFRPGDGLWGAEDNALLAMGAARKDGRRCPAVATLIILHHPPSWGCPEHPAPVPRASNLHVQPRCHSWDTPETGTAHPAETECDCFCL